MKTVDLVAMLGALVVSAIPPSASAQATASAPGRPGIAVKFLPDGDGVSVTVALNYLQKPADLPKFVGVRFYTYHVPFGPKPTRVGYIVTDPSKHFVPPLQMVVLHGRKYDYTEAQMDRQENGAMSVERVEGSPNKFRLQGVYDYFSQLFVLDEVLTFNQPVLLYGPLEVAAAQQNAATHASRG